MCHERFWRRRLEEADDSREIWADFEHARLIGDFEQPQEVVEPERTEVREEVTTAER